MIISQWVVIVLLAYGLISNLIVIIMNKIDGKDTASTQNDQDNLIEVTTDKISAIGSANTSD